VTVYLRSTSTLDAADITVPSGIWEIEVTNTGSRDADFDAWIARDDTALGWPIGGRQSYFDDPEYVRFDRAGRYVELDDPRSYVRRAGTLNGLATGARTVVVAGLRKSDRTVARYSAAGPIVVNPGTPPFPIPRPGPDPDAAAVSEDSPALRGILAAGTHSGAVVAMGGTSVAAPQVTRWIAGQMALGKAACRDEVDKLAAAAETALPVPDPRRVGNGRLDNLQPSVLPHGIKR
jgi:hypothetical protein